MSFQTKALPSEDEITFQSNAKVTPKKWGYAPEGALVLAGDRLLFITRNGVELDTSVSDIANLRAPWYFMGEGFFFNVHGARYSCGFQKLSTASVSGLLIRSGNPLGEVLGVFGLVGSVAGIMNARKLCKAWKTVLANAMQSQPAGG